ncbi:hypothetical protein JCM3770_006666 [Rhodotorula araucariae]
MGVSSLTSFVRKQNLGCLATLPSPDEPAPIPAIVDGLAFTYHVGLVDTFEGGGYLRIRQNVARYIEYWRACGLAPEFVWDGPFDSAKLPTVISRSTQSLQRSVTYMRLPDHLRAQHKFASAATRLPPLAHMCISAELERLAVPCHQADEEADSPTAELAQRRNGFVISNDSDYFIYPAQSRGYVPLNSILYGPYHQPRLEQVPPVHPPVLQFRVFQPAAIARAFSLPPSFLPILAALIGNDLANYGAALHTPRARSPFPGHVDARELLRLAGALSTCASMPVASLAQIQDIVFAVLPFILQGRAAPADPLLVANLAAAAHSYALRPLETPASAFPLHPRADDSLAQARARAAYLDAYRTARLSSFFPHVLKHAVVLLQGSVERPELQSPVVRLARPLRLWVYAVLQDAVGLRGETVTEYVRRGDALHGAAVPVPTLSSLLLSSGWRDPSPFFSVSSRPAALWPLPARLALFLHALQYPHPFPVPTAPTAPLLPLVLALRHLLRLLPPSQIWDAHAVRAALLVGALLQCLDPAAHAALASLGARGASPPSRESIHRSAELVQTLVGVHLVAQALLLDRPADSDPDSPGGAGAGVAAPHGVFDGRALHALWALRGDQLDRVLVGMPGDVCALVGVLEELVWQGLEEEDEEGDEAEV